MSRRYASLPGAADYAKVSERTIRRYIANGQLAGYRIGKRMIRVDLAEVDELLKPIPTAEGR